MRALDARGGYRAHAASFGNKAARDQRRDNRLRRLLVRRGFKTMRLWEHELRGAHWLGRLQRRLAEDPTV